MLKKRSGLVIRRSTSSNFKGKKAQVTIFIILGILILLAMSLVFLLRQEVLVFKPGEIPLTEKGKVERYITSCIKNVGEDALFLIGLHGGYIEVSGDLLADSSQHLKLSSFEVIPYWARGASTRIPSLDEIKKQIDDYIADELRTCLLDTETFKKNYDFIEKSQIKPDTQILDQKIIFNVKWDIEIRDKAGEIVTEIINHLAESKIKLKRVYETAKAIIQTEMNELKFEDLAIDLLSLDHPKVPLAGVEMSCSKKEWKVSEAKSTIQDMLRINLGRLRVEGTDYVDFPDSLPYYQNHYVWDIRVDHSDIGVNFHYNNNFPFSFEVKPRSGNLMKSGTTGGYDLLSNICVQLWKFTYSLMFPVQIEVIDQENNYVFHSAFTVHVKNNMPDRTSELLVPSETEIDLIDSEEYCKKRDIPITVRTYELIENNDTGVYWTDPLDEVDLTFTCLKYQCDVGQTEYGFAGLGHVAAYRTNFPYCAGGILRGKKEGYTDGWERILSNKEKIVDLNLIPLLEFPLDKIKIQRYGFDSLEKASLGEIDSIGTSLKSGETVSVKIMRNRDSWGKHEESVVISSDLDSGLLQQGYLKFLKGTPYEYELEVYLMDDEDIKGGYKGNWTVDWNSLDTANELVFNVLAKDSFGDQAEQFSLIADLEKYSQANIGKLGPKLNEK